MEGDGVVMDATDDKDRRVSRKNLFINGLRDCFGVWWLIAGYLHDWRGGLSL